MKRRSFLKRGLLSGAVAAGAAVSPLGLRQGFAGDDDVLEDILDDFEGPEIRLDIDDVKLELIDGKRVFMWAFGLHDDAPTIPGPVLRLEQGKTYLFEIRNRSTSRHSFTIPGMVSPDGLAVHVELEGKDDSDNSRKSILVQARDCGAFLYQDALNAPIGRVMGLHGFCVVEPKENITVGNGNIPYPTSVAPQAVTSLFETLGLEGSVFPGNGWKAKSDREREWIFNSVDPRWCDRFEQGQVVSAGEATDFKPRYFTLNGNSGYDAAHDHDCVPTGTIGQPLILRTANAGLAWHSPHIHGNHVYEFSRRSAKGELRLHDNIREIDTWTMPPGEIAELLLPFKMPPDIPLSKRPPNAQEKFPYSFPMHCHNEISQTSGGGSYPMGLVTDWMITGPYKG